MHLSSRKIDSCRTPRESVPARAAARGRESNDPVWWYRAAGAKLGRRRRNFWGPDTSKCQFQRFFGPSRAIRGAPPDPEKAENSQIGSVPALGTLTAACCGHLQCAQSSPISSSNCLLTRARGDAVAHESAHPPTTATPTVPTVTRGVGWTSTHNSLVCYYMMAWYSHKRHGGYATQGSPSPRTVLEPRSCCLRPSARR